MEELHLYTGRPSDLSSRLEKEIESYDFLDQLQIPYVRVDHEPHASIEGCETVDAILQVPMCKNLFLCNRQETTFYLLMMPGRKKFITKELSAQLQVARLSFARENYMEKFLNLTPGSVTVLGLRNDLENQVQLLIDEDLLKENYIACHPCINTSSLRFTTSDLLQKILPAMHHEPIIVRLGGLPC